MKFQVVSLFILVIGNFQGLSNGSDDVNLCERFLSAGAGIHWPSYDNPGAFFMCNGVERHLFECPAGLLFSFPCQVCVWPRDWVSPPPVNVISPNLPECVVDGTTSTPLYPTTTESVSYLLVGP